MCKAAGNGSRVSPKQPMRNPALAATILAGVAIAHLLLSGCEEDRVTLTPADLVEIREADMAYAEAWLSNDSSVVMATFVSDPVIVPSGMPALVGQAAIREFWWPEEAPLTTVHQFDLEQHEAGGQASVGFVRGSFVLAFQYAGRDHISAGEYLSVLERSDDGTWRISNRMWSDRPAEAGD